VIDWHCHILPGIDDGAADLEASISMGKLLAAAGFTDVYCTPHMMRGCYDVGNDIVRQSVTDLQEQLKAHSIALNLHVGREYCLDEYLLASLEDPLPLGDSRQILVEIQGSIAAGMVRQLLYAVVRSGFTPVIAHPERCRLLEPSLPKETGKGLLVSLRNVFTGVRRVESAAAVSGDSGNALLEYLRDIGCLFQGNLGSFNGFYGSRVRTVAETLRRTGVYDRYGSDLHAPEQAQCILAAHAQG